MTHPTTIITGLREARRLYEKGHPTIVAMARSFGRQSDWRMAMDLLCRAAYILSGPEAHSRFFQWSDDASTLKVIAAFDRAIALAEAEEVR